MTATLLGTIGWDGDDLKRWSDADVRAEGKSEQPESTRPSPLEVRMRTEALRAAITEYWQKMADVQAGFREVSNDGARVNLALLDGDIPAQNLLRRMRDAREKGYGMAVDLIMEQFFGGQLRSTSDLFRTMLLGKDAGAGAGMNTFGHRDGGQARLAGRDGGLIISGSPASVSSLVNLDAAAAPDKGVFATHRQINRALHQILGNAVTAGMPVVAVCYAMQALASKFAGAEIIRGKAAHKGIHQQSLYPEDRSITLLKELFGIANLSKHAFYHNTDHVDPSQLDPNKLAVLYSGEIPVIGGESAVHGGLITLEPGMEFTGDGLADAKIAAEMLKSRQSLGLLQQGHFELAFVHFLLDFLEGNFNPHFNLTGVEQKAAMITRMFAG